ncbi:MAG: alpha-1,2-fucosyltransferase [Bacteroidota bacterium]|nr:alpha-1,2-fucosyltransferase [Bacteroidota bacterium]
MEYTFVSLGRLESFGIRLGGAGLGNILFPWARALVYAKENNCRRIQTTWKNLKIGTFLRMERDKRLYFDLFTGNDGVSGLKKFWLLNFSNKVRYFKGMDDLFTPFQTHQTFVKEELLKIINPCHLDNANKFNTNSIAIHIRMGDFENPKNEQILRDGNWNYRLPIKWYKNIIEQLRKESDLPIFIFSDVEDEDLAEILALKDCKRAYFGSAISDMIALSNAKILVSSASTFSMWGSFLGQMPTIWFPGQLRQRLINDNNVFEGELDYDDELPISIKEIISNG